MDDVSQIVILHQRLHFLSDLKHDRHTSLFHHFRLLRCVFLMHRSLVHFAFSEFSYEVRLCCVEVISILQFPVSRYLGRLKADMFERNSRYFIYLFVR